LIVICKDPPRKKTTKKIVLKKIGALSKMFGEQLRSKTRSGASSPVGCNYPPLY
jgi:hypothetical protein